MPPPDPCRAEDEETTRVPIPVGYLIDTNRGPAGRPPPDPDEVAETHQAVLDLAVTAERAGFDGVYLPDRHARSETLVPSHLAMLAAIAAQTERVRLGGCATVLTLYDPMLLAETFSAIDHLSNGRLVFMPVLGYHEDYWRMFGINPERRLTRFIEGMEVLLKAWTEDDPWSYEGSIFDLHDVRLTPRPHQRPRPPVWVGGQVDAAIERAGRWGDAYVVDPFPLEPRTWVRQVDLFKRSAEAHGNDDAKIVALRQAVVADTAQEAERLCEESYLPALKFYVRRGLLTHHPEFRSEADVTLEAARRHAFVGTMDDCLEAAAEFIDQFNIDSLIIKFARRGGWDPEAEASMLQEFGRTVIPEL